MMDTKQYEGIELHPQDLERYLPTLNFGASKVHDTARKYLEACRSHIREIHEQNYNSEHILGVQTRMIDHLVIQLFNHYELEAQNKIHQVPPVFSLLAQGGYGRGEMNVHSDIDLLFLTEKKRGAFVEMVTEKLLYILWDLGLEVGYATRTLGECKRMMGEDLTIMTSLLDARHLAGSVYSKALIDEMARVIRSPIVCKKFITQKLVEKENRIAKNGASVFVLEPNVKESSGGLRDLQLVLWIARAKGLPANYEGLEEAGILNKEELRKILLARNFLWRVRNGIHLAAGKKADVLSFERQEPCAAKMGFLDSGGILSVEKFMQTYYQLAYQVATLTDTVLRRLTRSQSGYKSLWKQFRTKKLDHQFKIVDGQITAPASLFENRPLKMMTLFRHVQKSGMMIHPDTKDHVRANATRIEKFRKRKKAIRMFRWMMNRYENLGDTLFAMHECQFLDEWMPEFQKLRFRVQHDIYHIYTIDTHSIFAVNELSKLKAGVYKDKFDFYARVLDEIKRPELLTLSLLLHDIGKGEGGNHSVKGAGIAKSITERLQFSDEEKETVDFMIQSHLLMPHLSQRRDLEDPELIIKFAQSMGSLERLNILLLLTWADIRAVGPDAWTDWKGSLLQRLYEKTSQVLETGNFSMEATEAILTKAKGMMASKMGAEFEEEESAHFFQNMPPRYFLAGNTNATRGHFLLYREAKKNKLAIHFLGGVELTVLELFTVNSPLIFSYLTGLLSALKINIISAESFQTKSSQILLIFQITDSSGRPIPPSQYEVIKENITAVLFGTISIKGLLESKKVPDYLEKKPLQKAETRVLVDNDVSAYYTVIEIYTHDRLGLLYDITRVLNDQGCSIDVSKISTKVEQVSDVFYVKDIFGQKITSKDKIKNLKKNLEEVLA